MTEFGLPRESFSAGLVDCARPIRIPVPVQRVYISISIKVFNTAVRAVRGSYLRG